MFCAGRSRAGEVTGKVLQELMLRGPCDCGSWRVVILLIRNGEGGVDELQKTSAHSFFLLDPTPTVKYPTLLPIQCCSRKAPSHCKGDSCA